MMGSRLWRLSDPGTASLAPYTGKTSTSEHTCKMTYLSHIGMTGNRRELQPDQVPRARKRIRSHHRQPVRRRDKETGVQGL